MKSKQKSIKGKILQRSRAYLFRVTFGFFLTNHPAVALEEAIGHVELTSHYDVKTQTWEWKSNWFDDDLNMREDLVSTLGFPGLDVAPSRLGVRNTRPADSKWDFFGVSAGQPIWIYRDSENSSYTTLGFAATQAELSGPLTFQLDSVVGPSGGYFSLYSGTAPTVYMKTLDGISPEDQFMKPLQHSHVNWAFSRKGLWIVNLKVKGTVAATGAATVTSPAQPLVFAIGDYARWKAAHFNQQQLANSVISGDASDPDSDGWGNLMEYALGGDPFTPSAQRVSDSQSLAPRLLPPAVAGGPWRFSFFSRKAGSGIDISYAVESSTTLENSWNEETGTREILNSNSDWDEVAVTLGAPPSQAKGSFFRLKVSVIP